MLDLDRISYTAKIDYHTKALNELFPQLQKDRLLTSKVKLSIARRGCDYARK